MSSRPPPPPPLYPREDVTAAGATTTTPSSTIPAFPMMTAQAPPAAPYPLPPPSFLAPPARRGGPRAPTLPPLTPIAVPPLAPPPTQYQSPHQYQSPQYQSPQYPSPSFYTSPGYERWPSSARERAPPPIPPYTPPRSDPSYSPGYGPPLHAPVDFGGRPSLPGLEQRGWSAEPRTMSSSREAAPYPSPGYPDYRGSEEGHPSSATTARPPSLGVPSRPEVSYAVPEPASSGPSLARYEIRVRQQPRAARACGFGERDRRVIDPPPIVQLVLRDTAPGGDDAAELRYPFNVVHCTLWNEDGTVDETAIAGQERRVNRRLMGTLVASPFVAMDEHDQEGCFFCFPDLSCRTHGRYRLKFVLMRIDMDNLRPGGFMPVIISTMSDVFTVFTAKEFPGMRPSTPLTRALKRQGCAIPVKKGNERAGASARTREEEDDPGSQA
ncbi:MAG: hypothetical protein M1823_005106 [Watsoniomyces obsoletus]|nr:MAG: hypothetical protein M1823_005106 [Watsoniomyces obsoletus]